MSKHQNKRSSDSRADLKPSGNLPEKQKNPASEKEDIKSARQNLELAAELIPDNPLFANCKDMLQEAEENKEP